MNSGAQRYRLNTLVPGVVSGVVSCLPLPHDASEFDYIALLPDTSNKWSTQLAGARGVLIVGGGGLLSHLALLLREQGIPAFGGLTRDEAEQLAEMRVVIKDGELRVLDRERSPIRR